MRFENAEIEELMLNKDIGNAALTQEMLNYQPKEINIQFGGNAPYRLIYSNVEYTDEEKEAITAVCDLC